MPQYIVVDSGSHALCKPLLLVTELMYTLNCGTISAPEIFVFKFDFLTQMSFLVTVSLLFSKCCIPLTEYLIQINGKMGRFLDNHIRGVSPKYWALLVGYSKVYIHSKEIRVMHYAAQCRKAETERRGECLDMMQTPKT